MADTFAEMAEQYKDDNKEEILHAGDTCQESEDCEKELIELHHPRDSQLGTDPHPEAPITEVVCLNHGIVQTR